MGRVQSKANRSTLDQAFLDHEIIKLKAEAEEVAEAVETGIQVAEEVIGGRILLSEYSNNEKGDSDYRSGNRNYDRYEGDQGSKRNYRNDRDYDDKEEYHDKGEYHDKNNYEYKDSEYKSKSYKDEEVGFKTKYYEKKESLDHLKSPPDLQSERTGVMKSRGGGGIQN